MTVALSVSAHKEILPFELIHQGKIDDCHPKLKCPKQSLVTNTPSHWSTEKSIELYINKFLDPFFIKKRKEIGLAADHKGLLPWDVYKPHRTDFILELLEKKTSRRYSFQRAAQGSCSRWI